MKFTAGLSEIKRHNESAAHKKRMVSYRKQQSLSSWIHLNSPSTSKKDDLDKSVKFAEIKLASVFCEHNMSMKSIDHLSEVIREIFPDSEIAKNIKLHRTKCTMHCLKCVRKRGNRSSYF